MFLLLRLSLQVSHPNFLVPLVPGQGELVLTAHAGVSFAKPVELTPQAVASADVQSQGQNQTLVETAAKLFAPGEAEMGVPCKPAYTPCKAHKECCSCLCAWNPLWNYVCGGYLHDPKDDCIPQPEPQPPPPIADAGADEN